MKKEEICVIQSNRQIAPDIYRMVLENDTSWIEHPGQFVNLALPGKYLRRPISVCDWTKDTLTLIYKTVGEGTEQMSHMQAGKSLNVLTGLGNGFDTGMPDTQLLVIGGGVGIPPLYGLCRELIRKGKAVDVILGFNRKEEIFLLKEFEQLNVSVHLCTADGSQGIKGFVTDAMKQLNLCDLPYLACGPMPMLKAVYKTSQSHGWMSLEERMGCGFGACMGCTVKTKTGYKRVCSEGPVLQSEELPWAQD